MLHSHRDFGDLAYGHPVRTNKNKKRCQGSEALLHALLQRSDFKQEVHGPWRST